MAQTGHAALYLPGLKEDVSETIFQITPTEKPFYNMTGDSEAKEIVVQWQKRSISTFGLNSHLEGASFGNSAGHPTTREVNLCQIFKKEPTVTGSAEAVEKYGISSSFGDEMETAHVEIATDMELALIKGCRVSGSTTQTLGTQFTRQMDGLIQFLSRSSLWSRSTDVTMTEQGLNDVGQTIWEQGVKARDILCGMTFKRRIAGFAGWPDTGFGQQVQRNRDADDFTLAAEVDVYKTDVIDARVHVSRVLGNETDFSNAKFLILFDREMFSKCWLRKPFSARRAYTADSEDGVLLAELTLQGGHPNAGGWILAQ